MDRMDVLEEEYNQFDKEIHDLKKQIRDQGWNVSSSESDEFDSDLWSTPLCHIEGVNPVLFVPGEADAASRMLTTVHSSSPPSHAVTAHPNQVHKEVSGVTESSTIEECIQLVDSIGAELIDVLSLQKKKFISRGKRETPRDVSEKVMTETANDLEGISGRIPEVAGHIGTNTSDVSDHYSQIDYPDTNIKTKNAGRLSSSTLMRRQRHTRKVQLTKRDSVEEQDTSVPKTSVAGDCFMTLKIWLFVIPVIATATATAAVLYIFMKDAKAPQMVRLSSTMTSTERNTIRWAAPSALPIPIRLSVENVTKHEITLIWSPPEGNFDKVRLICTSKDGEQTYTDVRRGAMCKGTCHQLRSGTEYYITLATMLDDESVDSQLHIFDIVKTDRAIMDFINDNKCAIGGAILTGIFAPYAAPAALGAVGFGVGGIGAGTTAASLMSWSAVSAAGIGLMTTAALAAIGSAVGAGVGHFIELIY